MVASPYLLEAVAVVPWLCKFLPRIHPKLQQPGSSCNQTYFLPESFSFHVHVYPNPGPVRPFCAIHQWESSAGMSRPEPGRPNKLNQIQVMAHLTKSQVPPPNRVFRLYGIPLDIVLDLGPQFMLQVWKAFGNTLAASVSLSSGFHFQTNGQAEWANQDLEATLRCVVVKKKKHIKK